MKYCRTVTLPKDCRVYIEENKFKADKFILGKRVKIKDLPYWSDNDYCLNAVRNNVKSLKYIRDINHDLQLEALIHGHIAIRYLLMRGIEIQLSKEVLSKFGIHFFGWESGYLK